VSWVVVAGVLGTISVIAGAFGAHGLRESVTPERLALYASATGRSVTIPASLFSAGIALFSGSIFGLVLFELRVLGPVTPVGGVLLIAGWASLLGLARSAASG